MGKSRFGGTSQQIVLGLGAAVIFIMAIEASQAGFGGGFGFFGINESGAIGWHGASLRQEDGLVRARVHEQGCKIQLEQRGEVTFTADERDFAGFGSGASFEIEMRGCGDKFELTAQPGATPEAPKVAVKIDGRDAPWDDTARGRFQQALQLVFESTGYDAAGRADRIYARGGADAVLETASRMRTDAGQRTMLEQLLGKEDLAAEDAVRVWQLAGKKLQSDYELAQMIQQASTRHAADLRVKAALVEALRTIASDYELRRTLDVLLERGVDPLTLDGLLDVAAQKLNSDYEMAEFLTKVATALPPATPLPARLDGALDTLASDHELRRTLDLFVQREGLARADLDRLLRVAARRIGSDYELAELLIEVARSQKSAEPWPPALHEALGKIGSRHEQNRTREAFGASLDAIETPAAAAAPRAEAPETVAPN